MTCLDANSSAIGLHYSLCVTWLQTLTSQCIDGWQNLTSGQRPLSTITPCKWSFPPHTSDGGTQRISGSGQSVYRSDRTGLVQHSNQPTINMCITILVEGPTQLITHPVWPGDFHLYITRQPGGTWSASHCGLAGWGQTMTTMSNMYLKTSSFVQSVSRFSSSNDRFRRIVATCTHQWHDICHSSDIFTALTDTVMSSCQSNRPTLPSLFARCSISPCTYIQ